MIRVFGFAGWSDAYQYKPCLGKDLVQIDPNYIQRVKDFVNYATSKGIITIFSLFHNNGDNTAWITHASETSQREYIKAIVVATKGKAIVLEIINEDIDKNFCNFVQNEARKIDQNIKTCFYSMDGATYRIEHVLSKNYIGAKKIHSNDKSNYSKFYSANDYYNVAKQCKDQRGPGVEYLLAWSKSDKQLFHRSEIEAEYGATLDLLKTLR
jgi:hypothetical protein